jgi:hypothetical protein
MSAHPHQSDRSAAVTGLLVGAVVIFVVLFAIVKLTNAHYEGEKQAPGAAGAAK